jgi:beta-mannosidase
MTASSYVPSVEPALEDQLLCAWEMACSDSPTTPATLSRLEFVPASVPGTTASALRKQGMWRLGDGSRFDDREYWFRCRFDSLAAERGEELILRFGGIATIADVWLNGEQIIQSSSMFATHDVNVSEMLREQNELLIACRSLSAAVRERRGREPAARWRTRVVADQQLRWFRTTLLGRAPAFAAEPQPVGPWRPIVLVRQRRFAIEDWSRKVELDGTTGVITVELRIRSFEGSAPPNSGRLITGDLSAPFEWHQAAGRYHARAILRVPSAACWWPHTHGRPALYPLRLEIHLADESDIAFGDVPVGFRSVEWAGEPTGDGGLALKLNGEPIFCRGVVWTPPDVVSLAVDPGVIFERLRLLRDGGINLIRVAGTSVYEDESFHCACDELGLLVWQDLMFANMDYPFESNDFHRTVCAEAEVELRRIGRHASSSVVCGNSEIEQQVGMLGMNASIGRNAFFDSELPEILARCCPGVAYLPSAPCGGDLPFRPRRGVANYFGVGAYMRSLEDVRRSEVRFASECLAFANVPEPGMLDEMAQASTTGPASTAPVWTLGIPRDGGASWDFADVRDFYLKLLYSVDPGTLRYVDPTRYLELSRMVSGEVMAEVFGEWRRPASPCGGGIILWGADIQPGSGWGILDFRGQPKSVYWFLKRALHPCTVWTTDEGLNGVDIHVANDRAERIDVVLKVALYRSGERLVAKSEAPISVPPRRVLTFGAEEMLGSFVDVSYAFRFGPPGHDLLVASLYSNGNDIPLAQSFRFPVERPSQRFPIGSLGLAGECKALADGALEAMLATRSFAWGVRIACSGYVADDCYFGIEPGGKRIVKLTPLCPGVRTANPVLTAINAEGRVALSVRKPA